MNCVVSSKCLRTVVSEVTWDKQLSVPVSLRGSTYTGSSWSMLDTGDFVVFLLILCVLTPGKQATVHILAKNVV